MSETRERFNNIGLEYAELENKFACGSIDSAEYMRQRFELNDFLKTDQAFEKVEKQYDALRVTADKTGYPVQFISELTTDYIFGEPQRDMLNGILFTIMLTLCLSNVFPYDYKGKMADLANGTKCAKKLRRMKFLISCIIVTSLYAMVFLPENINLINYYKFSEFDAPIQSVVGMYSSLNVDMNIGEFILARHILGMAMSISSAMITLSISALIKRNGATIALSFLLLTAPVAVGTLGVDLAKNYSLCAAYNYFENMSGAVSIIPYAIATALFVAAGIASIHISSAAEKN
jgi:hypothetical protein